MNATYERESSDGGHAALDDRPLATIASDVLQKAEMLIRQELQLGLADAEGRLTVFRADLGRQLAELKLEMTAKVIGGAIAFAGALTLTAAVVLLLAKAFERQPWLAALIVGLVVTGIGVALLMRKVSMPQPAATELVPRRSFESIQHDVKSIEKAIK
jgi:Putative Actinobacterial Holin-X, holin superfamily III